MKTLASLQLENFGCRSLGPAMELHQRVPAEKWCITKSEFFAFVEDVREVWKRHGKLKDLSCMEGFVVLVCFFCCFFSLEGGYMCIYYYSFVCRKVRSSLLMCSISCDLMYVFVYLLIALLFLDFAHFLLGGSVDISHM